MTTYYKQKAYLDAKPSFHYLLSSCPQSSKNIYIIGSKVLEEEIEMTKDDAKKDILVDSLLLLQDLRVKYFSPEEANTYRAKKAIYLVKYRSSEAEKAFSMLDSSFKENPSDLSLYELQIYMKVYNYMVRAKKKNCEEMTIDYFSVMNHLNRQENSATVEKLKDQINEYADPCLNCNTLDSLALAAYPTKSSDTLWLDQQIDLLKGKSCKNSKALLQLIEKRFESKPDPKNAELLSSLYASEKEYVKAQTCLDRALNATTSKEVQASLLVEKAKIYQYQGNYSLALQYAIKSNVAKGNSQAYALAGDIAVSVSSSCSSLTFGGKELFWLAIDYYTQAASLSDSAEEKNKINGKVARYSKYFPEQSELFLKSVSEGSTYNIDCVINGTTRVRSKKQ